MDCVICGEPISFEYIDSVNEQLRDRQMCHTDNFWLEKARLAVDPGYKNRVVRVNGSHYMIGDEGGTKSFRGFGGHEFVIEFYDGRVVTSTNLWSQGEIPLAWRNIMPNNARFVKP